MTGHSFFVWPAFGVEYGGQMMSQTDGRHFRCATILACKYCEKMSKL